jgi:glycine betaine transporter
MHWLLLYSLILFYQFTPLQIEWIGLVVIGLYLAIAVLIILRRQMLVDPANG